MSWTLGLSIGQATESTAMVAVQEVGRTPTCYHLRHVDRFGLGTPYPNICERVGELAASDALSVPRVVADVTGVGRPVIKMLEGEGLSPHGVWVTGGDSVSADGREHRVPKRELASTVQTLLQSGRLRFAEQLPRRSGLVEELREFRAEVDISAGEEGFEHWREKDTDDIVLALACALWFAEWKGAPLDADLIKTAGPRKTTDGLQDYLS